MATDAPGEVTHLFGTLVFNGAVSMQANAMDARSQMAQALGRIFSRPGLDVARKKKLHEQIARRGQQAVLNSYAQVVTARKKTKSYRLGDRYAGGVLRRALASEHFYEATSEGFSFINGTRLDRAAKQWHRLNFGAGERGGGGRRDYPIRWGGLVSATIGLDDSASPGFGLPVGYFLGPEGRVGPDRGVARSSQPFFPLRKPQKFPTEGIAARRFLDTGVGVIAKLLPLAYQDYYREIYRYAKDNPESRIARFTTVTPRPQKTSARRRNYP